jgi:hypothetical protein
MTLAGWGVAIAVSLVLKIEGWGTLGGAVWSMAVSGALGLLLVGLLAVPARAILFPDLGGRDVAKYERWWP